MPTLSGFCLLAAVLGHCAWHSLDVPCDLMSLPRAPIAYCRLWELRVRKTGVTWTPLEAETAGDNMETSPGRVADRQTFGKNRLKLVQAGCSLTLMVAWYSTEDKRGVTKARPGLCLVAAFLWPAGWSPLLMAGVDREASHGQVKAAGPVWYLPGSLAQMPSPQSHITGTH